MSRATLRLLVVASLSVPATAFASWHIGPNFGLTYHSPDAGETSTYVSWGGSGSSWLTGVWQPGMRVGASIGPGQDEIYADTGLELASISGSSAHMFQASLNYQHGFSPARTDGAFATVGAGVFTIGGEHDSGTVPVVGGGIGYQHFLISGHGRVRGALRYERMGEDRDFGLDAANIVMLQLGFDLMP